MAFLEEVLNGVSTLQEIIQFRSADDVKLIILVFLMVFGFPLFLILKGRAKEIFVGIILGILFGVLVSIFS